METLYDKQCRKKFEQMCASEPREPGYSPSQLFSVMIVMGCGRERAKELIDEHAYGLDWSEATWEETRDYFRDCVTLNDNLV